MSKKIGMFLMLILVIWSILLLNSTKNRKPPKAAVRQPESTEAVTEPTFPESVPQETTVVPTTVSPEPPELSAVEVIMGQHTMNRTAVTHLFCEDACGGTITADLAELASRKEMNPIAAFWLLVSEGLYQRETDQPGLPRISLQDIPAQEKPRQYPYTAAGAAELLTDLLTLAGGMTDGLELGTAILGTEGALEPGQVLLSEEDDCRYVYFARSAEDSVQILCFYLRSDDRGEWIDDVEFQLLHMTAGSDSKTDKGQAAALAAAAELLMTGTHLAGSGEPAADYKVGSFKAEAERFFFTAEGEEGCLTNYRLKK